VVPPWLFRRVWDPHLQILGEFEVALDVLVELVPGADVTVLVCVDGVPPAADLVTPQEPGYLLFRDPDVSLEKAAQPQEPELIRVQFKGEKEG
jgi:hypothetical protein